ncbi:MAG TPA: hypothetical protein VMT79_22495 [Candidatus Binatia bacterium]|nr:hypothetical protein [Candidatus Binatia bacterium]
MDRELRDQAGDDPIVTRLLREQLPRHPASPRLRAAMIEMIAPPPRARRWGTWLAPALSALATAMIATLLIVPRLAVIPPGVDSLSLLVHGAVAEQAHNMAWGQVQPDVAPAILTRAMEESGIPLTWVFMGDPELRFVNARATLVERHRALSLAYQTVDGHAVTYVVLPGRTVVLPDEGRVQIEHYRPVLRQVDGFSLILWKQQGLFCVLVSDLVSEDDVNRLKLHFLRIRSATEPYAVY